MGNADDPTRDERKLGRTTAVATPRGGPAIGAAEDGGSPRFVVGDEIGRGGMGRVVAAVDTVLDRQVAIKFALSDADAQRFEREAKITAGLEHPSIVPIHDAGRDPHGRPFYVMRRIAGEPLADRIAATRDVWTRLALVPRFVVAVDATGFAHARGVIHCDIKPSNILLGAHGETLLIDWGLARWLDEPNQSEGVAGTPGYMAPEQARGDRMDERTDVYALGATLLDILTGRVGRAASSPTRWIERAAANLLPPPDMLDPDVPAELVAIVRKALALEPADRYRNAGELAADLHAFLDGRLVGAHRYTPLGHLARFVRRHRLVVTIAVLALGAVATTGALAVRGVIHERDLARAARRDAEDNQRLAAERADITLLDRAAQLADRDPTRAAALLSTLPSTSRHVERARDIATIAALHGIQHGTRAHRGAILALALAPDNHRLLSAGVDGTMQIHDLASGAGHVIVREPDISWAIWTDGGATITYHAHGMLRIVDVASGVSRTLGTANVVDQLWAPGDGNRVRMYERERAIVSEIGTDGANTRSLASDVAIVAFDGDLTVVAGAGTIRMVDSSGEHVVTSYAGPDPVSLAISSDGARVAAVLKDVAFEWEVRGGSRRGPWPGINRVMYAGSSLLGVNPQRRGELDRLFPSGGQQALAGNWAMSWSTRAGSRFAMINQDGDLAMLADEGDREFRLDPLGARILAGRPDSPYLAIGSRDGAIRWWDLRQFVSESYQTSNGQLCDVDPERLYVLAPGQLVIVPRSGGEAQRVDMDGFACVGRVGTQLVIEGMPDTPVGFYIVDSATGRTRHLLGKPFLGPNAIYSLRSRDVYEVTDGEPVLRWTAPSDVVDVVAGPQGIGFELATGQLVRVDAKTNTMATLQPVGPATAYRLGSDGSWWYGAGSKMFHDHRLLGELGSPAQLVWPVGDEWRVLAEDRSLWRVGVRGLERLVSIEPGLFALGRRTFAMAQTDGVRLTFFDTGQHTVLPIRGALGARLFDGDRTIAIVQGGTTMQVDVFHDPVPEDPAALSAWLHTATNATIVPGDEAVGWR